MHPTFATAQPAERLDRMPVSLLHCAIVLLCALGFAFDLLEMTLGTALGAVFSMPPHQATPAALTMLLSSVYAGAVLGAALFGWIGERHGRKAALGAMLLLLAATSGAGALSASLAQLCWWRFCAGIALGAYPPLMMAYLTDILPPARRGTLIFLAVAIATVGPVSGPLLMRALVDVQPLGLEGWRWTMLAGGIGAGVIGLLFLLLPESPRWLLLHGRAREADLACDRLAHSRPVMAGGAAGEVPASPRGNAGAQPWRRIAALYFLSPWATVAFPLLVGAMLVQKGVRLADSLLYVGFSAVGPLAGNAIAALAIDRVGRRAGMLACALGMAVAGTVFVTSATPWLLGLGSFAFTLFLTLYLSVLNLYTAETFPTAQRARATAGAWACNRVAAALAPLLLLPLLAAHGPRAMFALIALTLAAGALLLVFCPPGAPRRPVA